MPTPKGFVLLKENCFDSAAFFRTLQHEWDIVPDDGYMQEGERISFNIRDNICAISLMPAPVPNREAEACAELNYFWPEAAATTRQHRAHLAVVVMPVGYSSSDIDCMSLYRQYGLCPQLLPPAVRCDAAGRAAHSHLGFYWSL